MPRKKGQPRKKIQKASKRKSPSRPRVAVRRGATMRRTARFTRPRALARRLPGSFPALGGTSAWANSVMHPFNEEGFKIPDLVSGPPSVLLQTTDLTNTFSANNWPESPNTQEQTLEIGDGVINFVNRPGINTTGQQLLVQFLPCVMSPASYHLHRSEIAQAFAGSYPAMNGIKGLIEMLAYTMEQAADRITPVLGWWMVLDSEGYIKSVDLLKADKLMTADDALKLLRLTKAGIKVTLQQPKFSTGGQCYLNKGAGAFLPFYSINDEDGDGVVANKMIERVATFKVGQRCIIGDLGGQAVPATKNNVVKLASSTAGTHVEALDVGGKSHTMASYPLDSVKALEYMPYAREQPWSFDDLVHENPGNDDYGGHPEDLDKLDGTAERIEAGLNLLTGGSAGVMDTTPGGMTFEDSSAHGVGYNADRINVRWCPGWMIFHPTFTTSVAPEKIIANLEIETFTAWEFVPYPRTFAHLARTPGHIGKADARFVPPVFDTMSRKGGHTAKHAPGKHRMGRGHGRGGKH